MLNQNKFFITGIGTDVGKTVVSAIFVEALEADYWKPIQAGDLNHSDSHKVKGLISNDKSTFHANSYGLNTPMSPHAAAKIDGLDISSNEIKEPKTSNHLIIEGAGGLLVPLNNRETIFDIIKPDYKVIVVSRNYLGSINHTLLTLEYLEMRNVEVEGLIFNGEENKSTQEIIAKKTGVKVLGRIEWEKEITKEFITRNANNFKDSILSL